MIANLDRTRKTQADDLSRQAKIDLPSADQEVMEAMLEEIKEISNDIVQSPPKSVYNIESGDDPEDDVLFDDYIIKLNQA
jgi:cell division FtsZ-interacting protein ZapD